MANGLRLLLGSFATGLPRAASKRRIDSCNPISAAWRYVLVCERFTCPSIFLHMMDRPARLQPATACFISEVVEVEIDQA
jgi:hypothetical protein